MDLCRRHASYALVSWVSYRLRPFLSQGREGSARPRRVAAWPSSSRKPANPFGHPAAVASGLQSRRGRRWTGWELEGLCARRFCSYRQTPRITSAMRSVKSSASRPSRRARTDARVRPGTRVVARALVRWQVNGFSNLFAMEIYRPSHAWPRLATLGHAWPQPRYAEASKRISLPSAALRCGGGVPADCDFTLTLAEVLRCSPRLAGSWD